MQRCNAKHAIYVMGGLYLMLLDDSTVSGQITSCSYYIEYLNSNDFESNLFKNFILSERECVMNFDLRSVILSVK